VTAAEVETAPLSAFHLGGTAPPALLLGYAGFTEPQMHRGAEALAGALTALVRAARSA
jgi:hypothetical protein